jgi:hypothetical protein
LLLAAALASSLAATSSAALAGPPRVQLSVSPASVSLSGPSARTLKLRNDGTERVVVDVTRRTADGKTAARTWLGVVPTRLSLRAGATAVVTVRVTPPRGAEPGDHRVLVLLTTRPLRSAGGVNVQARLGVRVNVRLPGLVLRRLAFGRVRLDAQPDRALLVPIANRGNVSLVLRGHVKAYLAKRGRRVARLSASLPQALRPSGRTVLGFRVARHLHGRVTAVIRIRVGATTAERRYRLRL